MAVCPSALPRYRERYPHAVFLERPSDESVVGDGRFWIEVVAKHLLSWAEQNGQPTDYFERFVSLDDDVQSFQSTRGDQLAVPMEKPLQELQQRIKDNGKPEPGLAGFLAFRPTAPPSEDWETTKRPHVAVSVSARVLVQYHPHAQLAEDHDFGQRLAEVDESLLKFNAYAFHSARHTDASGATREPTAFSGNLYEQLQALKFKPSRATPQGKRRKYWQRHRVRLTGTPALLRDAHPWSIVSGRADRPVYDFRLLRPAGLGQERSFGLRGNRAGHLPRALGEGAAGRADADARAL